jgi:hypothetical protein
MTKSEIKAKIKEINKELNALLQDDRKIKNKHADNWREDLKQNDILRDKLLGKMYILQSELINPTLISASAEKINDTLAQIFDLEWELREKKRQFNLQLKELEQLISIIL